MPSVFNQVALNSFSGLKTTANNIFKTYSYFTSLFRVFKILFRKFMSCKFLGFVQDASRDTRFGEICKSNTKRSRRSARKEYRKEREDKTLRLELPLFD